VRNATQIAGPAPVPKPPAEDEPRHVRRNKAIGGNAQCFPYPPDNGPEPPINELARGLQKVTELALLWMPLLFVGFLILVWLVLAVTSLMETFGG